MNNEIFMVEHPRDTFARANTLGSVYFEIAQSEYCEFIRIQHIDTKKLNDESKSKWENLASQAAIKSVVFSAMCVEASINNYAGGQLGDKYFEQHLGSLDVVSKWVVIPRLICGKSIDKSGPAFSALKILISSRNSLIHNKSYEMNLSNPESMIQKMEKRNKDFYAGFHNALKALYLLSMEMDYVIGQMHNPLRTLNNKFSPNTEIPPEAKELFETCKNIVSKQYSKNSN
ncbi:hypothetical protein [Shewanella sp. KT0246]|uniref:hypothetical protein n=1 Tax=Shewanella sp. KT0246 TaxID=2815912 RepID=UPI001BC09331|nr:hypothetical protein [Shewanella sp. KT0246]GIU53809.1 hypothetical protein TUM4249_34500 [Shewanella sp. KT0246]